MRLKAFDRTLLNPKYNKDGSLKAFTISRKYWGNGSNTSEGLLLNNQNLMCCLGFASLACGATKKQILNNGLPSYIGGVVKKSFNDFIERFRKAEVDIAEINDKTYNITEEERETKIKGLFVEQGVEVTFVD